MPSLLQLLMLPLLQLVTLPLLLPLLQPPMLPLLQLAIPSLNALLPLPLMLPP